MRILPEGVRHHFWITEVRLRWPTAPPTFSYVYEGEDGLHVDQMCTIQVIRVEDRLDELQFGSGEVWRRRQEPAPSTGGLWEPAATELWGAGERRRRAEAFGTERRVRWREQMPFGSTRRRPLAQRDGPLRHRNGHRFKSPGCRRRFGSACGDAPTVASSHRWRRHRRPPASASHCFAIPLRLSTCSAADGPLFSRTAVGTSPDLTRWRRPERRSFACLWPTRRTVPLLGRGPRGQSSPLWHILRLGRFRTGLPAQLRSSTEDWIGWEEVRRSERPAVWGRRGRGGPGRFCLRRDVAMVPPRRRLATSRSPFLEAAGAVSQGVAR